MRSGSLVVHRNHPPFARRIGRPSQETGPPAPVDRAPIPHDAAAPPLIHRDEVQRVRLATEVRAVTWNPTRRRVDRQPRLSEGQRQHHRRPIRIRAIPRSRPHRMNQLRLLGALLMRHVRLSIPASPRTTGRWSWRRSLPRWFRRGSSFQAVTGPRCRSRETRSRLVTALDDTRAARVLALLRDPTPELLDQLGHPGPRPAAQAVWCHHAYHLEIGRTAASAASSSACDIGGTDGRPWLQPPSSNSTPASCQQVRLAGPSRRCRPGTRPRPSPPAARSRTYSRPWPRTVSSRRRRRCTAGENTLQAARYACLASRVGGRRCLETPTP